MGARTSFFAGALCAVALAAWADSAGAQDAVCGGQAAAGEVLTGPVLHVPDAQTICVARSHDPKTWGSLSVSDADRASITEKRKLESAAFAQDATCSILPGRSGRPAALCRIAGVPLAERLQAPATLQLAKIWR